MGKISRNLLTAQYPMDGRSQIWCCIFGITDALICKYKIDVDSELIGFLMPILQRVEESVSSTKLAAEIGISYFIVHITLNECLHS